MTPKESAKVIFGVLHDDWFSWTPEVVEAFNMAISALEKQERDRWIPFKCREATDDDCKWNEDGMCKGPVQPAGHTALYIRQNWYGWQQCDDFKDKAEEGNE